MSTRSQIRRQGLALAVAVALGLTGNAVFAQSTVGAVYGTADAGAQVELVNLGNGATRTVTVGSDGKFNVSSMLPGEYKVTETTKGQPISRTITVVAGQGFNLNLVSADSASTSGAENLGAVSVTANALPPVDVSSVQVNTVLTAEQMKSLPIARNQTAVALLTPGAVRGDGAFGNLASFGGASVAENSYYVNGFNTTNFYQSLRFAQVPFEAIDQQSVQEGGYGAEYGNSTGGVVSVQTKRGTNEWKGGIDYTWNPTSLQVQPADDLPEERHTVAGQQWQQELPAGEQRRRRRQFGSRQRNRLYRPLERLDRRSADQGQAVPVRDRQRHDNQRCQLRWLVQQPR